MSNFGIKINLMKVKQAFVANIQGKAATKRCICIPIDDSDLFIGEKGVYLDLAAFEMQDHKYDDTHLVKVSVKKEVYDALTDEERKNQPIIGSMRPIATKQAQMDVTNSAVALPGDGETDDLPF
jgi:hypothetical protein